MKLKIEIHQRNCVEIVCSRDLSAAMKHVFVWQNLIGNSVPDATPSLVRVDKYSARLQIFVESSKIDYISNFFFFVFLIFHFQYF